MHPKTVIKKTFLYIAKKTDKRTEEEKKHYFLYEYVPQRVRLDASTICQLRCTGCGFQKGGDDDLGRGFLTLENFRKFSEMNPFIREIELSNFGEIFLNPNLIAIMRHAKERNITLCANNGVNFNTVSDEQIQALVETGFRSITMSIDGASQETYSQYRVNGHFDTVIENIKKLQTLKKKAHSKYPLLRWQFILMEHNELEIAKAKQMAAALEIPIFFKYNWDPSYKPIHREYIIRETGMQQLTRAEYIKAHKISPFNHICEQLFIRPQINWDGRMLGCCNRTYAAFDTNVFETGLLAAMRSPEYIEAMECLMNVHPDKEKYGSCACYDCEIRRQRETAGLACKPERLFESDLEWKMKHLSIFSKNKSG